jgi:hypothetical protein
MRRAVTLANTSPFCLSLIVLLYSGIWETREQALRLQIKK